MSWATRQTAIRLYKSYGRCSFSSTSLLKDLPRARERQTSLPQDAAPTAHLVEELKGLEKVVDAISSAPLHSEGKKSVGYKTGKSSLRKEGQELVILVRFPRRIASILEVYAIVRAVEDKYGRVKDFKVSRDREIVSEYLFIIYLVLEDPSLVLENPLLSSGLAENLEVCIPSQSSSDILHGGVSLADLYNVLGSENRYKELINELRRENSAPQSSEPLVLAKLRIERPEERTGEFSTISRPVTRFRVPRKGRLARAFVAWGGFASQPSKDTSLNPSPITAHANQNDSKKKHYGKITETRQKLPTMQTLMEKHTQHLRMLDRSDKQKRAFQRSTEDEEVNEHSGDVPNGARNLES